ncbi:MAG: DUF502 domain-containing protein [Bdellovibrionales bacterium]|nr:DUF502 domain-containing protein [Bdellovibrionales bacterium]
MKILRIFKIAVKRYFIFGIIVFLPLVITVKFLFWIIAFFDNIFAIDHGRFLYIIPERFHPHQLLGIPIPGLGIAISVLCILALGALSRNYVGKQLIQLSDSIVDHIPLARSIYKVVRDIVQTYARQGEQEFNKVVMIRFPHSNSYSIGFLTGEGLHAASDITGKPMLNVFVPTTPNPTSGFLLFIPKDEVTELDWSIEEAFRLIVSGGMINPENNRLKIKP